MKIIAEIGSNWSNYDDLLKSIKPAIEDGADIIKYQFFTSTELYGFKVPEVDKYSIPVDILQDVAKECKIQGIEFMCSGFSIEAYEHVINPLVHTHKIASSEAHDPDLVSSVLSYDKPTIISTGGLSFSSISNLLNFSMPTEITIMYCDANYPSYKTIDDVLEWMRRACNLNVDIGYSDHTLDIKIEPSIARHSLYIEKHYNPLGLANTPDAKHSLNRIEFQKYVESCKLAGSIYTENKYKRLKTQKGYFRPYK